MTKDLNKFYFDNKFKTDKNIAYGIYKDRTLSIIEKGQMVKVSVGFNSQISQEVGQQVSIKLKELKLKHKALQHGLTTNVCVEIIIYKSADFQFEFFQVLDDVLSMLDNHIPAMVDMCPICGQAKPSNAPFVKIKDTVVQAHEHCIEQLIGASNKMGASVLLSFNKVEFFKTILISMLSFLLVTGIVCVASYYGFFGFVSSISGYGTYLISSLLMRKAKVQIRKNQLILVAIFTILSVFSSIYLGSVIDIFRSNENITLGFIFANYFNLLIQNFATLGKYILLYLLIGLGFIVPTIIFNFKQLNDNLNAIKKLK